MRKGRRMSNAMVTTTSRASDVTELRARLAEAEETLAAIRNGEVDALVVSGAEGDRVFTLQGADKPYRLLMEAMNEGALTTQPDGPILYFNQRFAEMVQAPIQQVIGASLQRFVQEEHQPWLRKLLANLPGAGTKTECLLCAAQTGAAPSPVQLSLRPLEVDGVRAVAVVAAALSEGRRHEEPSRRHNEELERRVEQRTSALAQANAALRKAQHELKDRAHNREEQVAARTAALQESMRSLEQFCYSIAHDLRAPLRTIQGFIQVLFEEFKPQFNECARDYADRIVKAASRMDQLLRDLLAYGRLTSASLPLQPVDLGHAVAQAVAHVRAAESRDNARIDVRGPLPTVQANSVVLGQVLENLLSNALKFVGPGVTPRIQISAKPHGDRARLSLRDNGIGINPEFQERIFGVFERLAPEEYPGTGIGLAIVQKGVERMGGKAGVDSQLGKGS